MNLNKKIGLLCNNDYQWEICQSILFEFGYTWNSQKDDNAKHIIPSLELESLNIIFPRIILLNIDIGEIPYQKILFHISLEDFEQSNKNNNYELCEKYYKNYKLYPHTSLISLIRKLKLQKLNNYEKYGNLNNYFYTQQTIKKLNNHEKYGNV